MWQAVMRKRGIYDDDEHLSSKRLKSSITERGGERIHQAGYASVKLGAVQRPPSHTIVLSPRFMPKPLSVSLIDEDGCR